MCCVGGLMAMNFGTIFFYTFERAFRLLFRSQLDIESVSSFVSSAF